MKHLKKFNENIDSLYTQISIDELQRSFSVDINMNIYDKIRLLISNNYDVTTSNDMSNLDENGYEINSFSYIEIEHKIKANNRIDIMQSDDEWFYVYVLPSRTCYKCDQVEGLLQLLKDRNITI